MDLPPRLQRKMLRRPRRLPPVIGQIPQGCMTGDNGEFISARVVSALSWFRMVGFDDLSPEEREAKRNEMKSS